MFEACWSGRHIGHRSGETLNMTTAGPARRSSNRRRRALAQILPPRRRPWRTLGPGTRLDDVGKADEVGAGERAADLLHLAARDQIAQVDRDEACVLEQCTYLGLRARIIA